MSSDSTSPSSIQGGGGGISMKQHQQTINYYRRILKKMMTFNLQPTEDNFSELPDVLIWLRAFLGIIYGIFFLSRTNLNRTNLTTTSGTYLLQGLNFICFVPVIYCRVYLGAKPDVFPNAIIFSGLFNALALCLLLWIYYYTKYNEYEINQLNDQYIVSTTASESAFIEQQQQQQNDIIGNEPIIVQSASQMIMDEQEF